MLYNVFFDDRCQQSAAALTYMTLFSLVPLVSVMYAVLAWIPSFQNMGNQLNTLIFSNFVPSAGQEIVSYIDDFSRQTRNLSIVGASVLFVTAIMMMKNIERVFNQIWSTPHGRKGVFSFLLYWAILSLGPLLLGLSIAMSTYLLSAKMLDIVPIFKLNWLLPFLPVVFSSLALTMIYFAVPNYKVPFKDALVGGIVAAIAFELAKRGFTLIVANSSFTSIYGAFAIIPLFLLWVYLVWNIVLIGAEFVRGLETFSRHDEQHSYSQLHIALLALWALRQGQKRNMGVNDRQIISLGISFQQWRKVRDTLLLKKVITVAENKDYLLLCDLHELNLWQLNAMVGKRYSKVPDIIGPQVSDIAWNQHYRIMMSDVETSAENTMHLTIAQLFNSNNTETDAA